MKTERLAAFSDGVIAIIITIMVLELKVPHSADWHALAELWPVFFSYVLSFIFVGIYWNNHHHLLHACKHVTGGIMWANMHLLFWLSLIPFSSGWMGENHFAAVPVAVYGISMLAPALAYPILQQLIVRANGDDKVLAKALGSDIKGKASPWFCIAGIAFSFVNPWISCGFYVALALLWLVPDRRIERGLNH